MQAIGPKSFKGFQSPKALPNFIIQNRGIQWITLLIIKGAAAKLLYLRSPRRGDTFCLEDLLKPRENKVLNPLIICNPRTNRIF